MDKLIIRIGKRLLAAQKEAKAEGESFKDWFEKVSLGTLFTSIGNAQRYMAIARYPSAFKADMWKRPRFEAKVQPRDVNHGLQKWMRPENEAKVQQIELKP